MLRMRGIRMTNSKLQGILQNLLNKVSDVEITLDDLKLEMRNITKLLEEIPEEESDFEFGKKEE